MEIANEYHNCHFCGTYVLGGYEYNGERHFLSDCRPDLVEHEPGPVCTWFPQENKVPKNCYAYQNRETNKWEDKHIYFYENGPM